MKIKKITKTRYIQTFLAIVLALGIAQEVAKEINGEAPGARTQSSTEGATSAPTARNITNPARARTEGLSTMRGEDNAKELCVPEVHHRRGASLMAKDTPHRIYSVSSYTTAFPDDNDTQLRAAMRHGIRPLASRDMIATASRPLVDLRANPYYHVDHATRSVPYLVPRAATLLQDIGQNFLDSLRVKGIPAHKIIVTSVLRTEDDVARLQRHNVNATTNSCHQYATTFDITYNRYETVTPPGDERHAVRQDTLKWVLSEVLNDLRQQGRCYVKYERKQACFHVTTR